MIEQIPLAWQAVLWGAVAGSALIIGAFIGYCVKLPHYIVSGIMAFGAGVLISALSFNLMQESVEQGGISAAIAGFIGGVIIYSAANAVLDSYGARHRKRSNRSNTQDSQSNGGAFALALGALLDGIPEAAAIGVSLLDGEGVALIAVGAIFLSNVPEGLSSAAGMKQEGHGAATVFGLWSAIALINAVAAWAGYSLIGRLDEIYIAAATAVAAGAILVMIVQTMIPEAVHRLHGLTGPIAATGFLITFAAEHLFAG